MRMTHPCDGGAIDFIVKDIFIVDVVTIIFTVASPARLLAHAVARGESIEGSSLSV